jgi:hypothetical protein
MEAPGGEKWENLPDLSTSSTLCLALLSETSRHADRENAQMPKHSLLSSDTHSLPVGEIVELEAIRLRIGRELLEWRRRPSELAAEIGISAKTLRNFQSGMAPYSRTRTRLSEWAADRAPEEVPAQLVALALACEVFPAEMRPRLRRLLGRLLGWSSCRRSEVPPQWVTTLAAR